MISFKGRHHKQEIILQCVRWYVTYSLSYRDLEELMQERGYAVDHSSIHRWVVYFAPRIEKAFRKNKKRSCNRWRLDETYIKIKGEWISSLSSRRQARDTIDFLLTGILTRGVLQDQCLPVSSLVVHSSHGSGLPFSTYCR